MTRPSPGEVLARIPGWEGGEAHIEPLGGGLTNRSYRVVRRGERFVLRLDAEHTAAFGLDRRRELAVLKLAADAGLGPPVVHADPDRGVLMTRYLEGEVWSPDMLGRAERLAALAALLRRVHALPTCGVRFDAKRIAAGYLSNLKQDDALYDAAVGAAADLERLPAGDAAACCHNDVVAANLIGLPPRLLDWEYACDNDPAFDLASLIEYHALDAASSARLLAAYAGGARTGLAERVELQRRIYVRLTVLWFAARRSVTPGVEGDGRLRALLARLE